MPPALSLTRIAVLAVVAACLILLAKAPLAQPASAHGKELDITVTPLIPDPDQPLLLLYRVHVVFRNDREPVQGASVALTARRQDSDAALPAMELTEVQEAHG